MHIKIALTEDIINECLALHYGKQVTGKKLKQRLFLIPSVLIIISAYLIYNEFNRPQPGPNLYLAILYIAFAIAYYLYMKNRMLKSGKQLLKTLGNNASFTMDVNENHLTTTTSTNSFNTDWEAFKSAIISKDNVLLYQADNSFSMFNYRFFYEDDFAIFKAWTKEKVSPVNEVEIA